MELVPHGGFVKVAIPRAVHLQEGLHRELRLVLKLGEPIARSDRRKEI